MLSWIRLALCMSSVKMLISNMAGNCIYMIHIRWLDHLQIGTTAVPQPYHCHDVIMSVMASQITSLTIYLLNRLSKHRWKKTSKLRVAGLCAGNTPVTVECPLQRASNAKNVSIRWRHHAAGEKWSIFSHPWMMKLFIPIFPKLLAVQTPQIFTKLICFPRPAVSVFIQLGGVYITLGWPRYGWQGSSVVME